MSDSNRALATSPWSSARSRALGPRPSPQFRMNAAGETGVVLEEAERMISSASRKGATTLWYEFYQQLIEFQRASDRELLEWYTILRDYKALGFSDEHGRQLQETGVNERLEQVRKRINERESRSRNVLKFLRERWDGERARHLEEYFANYYKSAQTDSWAGILKALLVFETPREFVQAINTAMVVRHKRETDGFIPEPIRDDIYMLNASIRQYKEYGTWEDGGGFDEELLKSHGFGFHPSGILMCGPKKLDCFPAYEDEASEESGKISIASSVEPREEAGPKAHYPQTVDGPSPTGPASSYTSTKPFPESDFDQLARLNLVGLNADALTDPFNENSTPEQQIVQRILDNLAKARDPESPTPEPLSPVEPSSGTEDSGRPGDLESLEDAVGPAPDEEEAAPAQLFGTPEEQATKKRKGGADGTPSGPRHKRGKITGANDCAQNDTCCMSAIWKHLLGKLDRLPSDEKGRVLYTYIEGEPFPCDFHVQQLETVFSLEPTGGGADFYPVFGLVKKCMPEEQTDNEGSTPSDVWLAPSFQHYLLNTAPPQRIRRRAIIVEQDIALPLESDLPTPETIIDKRVDTSVPFLPDPFILWLCKTPGGDLTRLLVQEIEMFYQRLRRTVGSNGRLLNSAFSMAAQAISSDPAVWRHFAQLMGTKNLASFPLPARYYPEGEVSSIFYEADEFEGSPSSSFLAEYVLSGEKVQTKYLAPSPLVSEFVASITNSPRTPYVDFSSDDMKETLMKFVTNHQLHWVTLETSPHSTIFYPTGTIVWHCFELTEARISIPISLVRIVERNGRRACAGVPYDEITQAHLVRKAPATNRFGGQEELVKHLNWDPEIKEAGALFDLLRCRKEFEHPAVQAELKKWSEHQFSSSPAPLTPYPMWYEQLEGGIRRELRFWRELEMKIYGEDKSFYFKQEHPGALEAPPVPETIVISDDEDDEATFLPNDRNIRKMHADASAEVFEAGPEKDPQEKKPLESISEPDANPIDQGDPEPCKPAVPNVPGIGEYPFPEPFEQPLSLWLSEDVWKKMPRKDQRDVIAKEQAQRSED